jgi:predicted dehydrogenase
MRFLRTLPGQSAFPGRGNPVQKVPGCYHTFVKIGIIGLGFMGATHLKSFLSMESVSVLAVSANNPKALEGDLTEVGGNLGRETAKYDFSQVRKYRNWRDLVNDPEVDAVDVCLPTNLHLEVVTAALQAGKHVLCEKPMALTANECDRMIEAAEQTNKILMIGQVLRFWPEYQYLEQFIRSGQYGKIRTATFVRRSGVPDWSKWLLDSTRSGGALLDLLVHDVDQALMLFGMPQKVAAKSLGEVDTVSATLMYGGGPEVRIQGGWFPSGTPFAMGFQVLAERGHLELTPDGLRLSDEAGNQQTVALPSVDGYDAEVKYFVRCCETGERPERCLPADSARAVKLALAMGQSRAEGGKQIECAL